MATFEKYRRRQQAQQSTLLSQALVESKSNVLSPQEGNVSKSGSFFNDINSEIQEEEERTEHRLTERSESVKAAPSLFSLRRAYAVTTTQDKDAAEGDDEDDDEDDEEEEGGEEDCPDSDLSKHPHDQPSVSGHALEVVYRETLRVIVNRVGATDTSNAVASSDMYAHLQNVYRVDDATHQSFLGKEQAREKPAYHLQVKVIAGQALDGMDENGLSDPFCILGVVSLDEAMLDRRSGNKKMKKVSELTDNVMRTSVKPKTLEPEWNEMFDFPVSNLSDLYLQVDVWDRDEDDGVSDALKRGSSVKGLRGFGKFLQNVAEAATTGTRDDFMGRCYVPLDAVHQSGVDTWFPMESRRARSVNGALRLKLAFIRDNSEDACHVDPAWSPHRVYETLYWDFVRHEIHVLQQRGVFRWRGRLSRTPTSLLQLFRVQQGISTVHHMAREWQVLAEAQQRHGVKFSRLIECLDVLSTEYRQAEEQGIRLNKSESTDLVSSLDEFVTTTLRLLGKQRDIFPPNTATSGLPAVKKLSNLLVSLSAVYKFQGFTDFFPRRDLKEDIIETIRASTAKWFQQIEAQAAPAVTGIVHTLRQLTEVVRSVKNDLVDAGHFYDHHFQSHLAVSYFEVVFKELDHQVSSRVSRTMVALSQDSDKWVPHTAEGQEISSASFQLFIAIQEVVKYCAGLQQHNHSLPQSELKDFHSWFKPFIGVWLSVAEIKAIDMVQKAVELDRAVKATSDLKYGTSAVDVANIVKQLCNYFRRLDWPEDEEERFKYLTSTYEACLNALGCYGKYVEDKLRQKGYYDTAGQFDISEALTTTLNGLDHSKAILNQIPVDLCWDELTVGVREIKGPLVDEVRQNMLDLYGETNGTTRKRIIQQIGVRMHPDLQRKTDRFLSLCKEERDISEALDPLMMYLAENLKMLSRELIPDTFMQIMAELYRCSVKVFHEAVLRSEEGLSKPPTAQFYKSVKTGLEVLVDFFESGDDGLKRDQLDTAEYLTAASHLELYCADGEHVVRHYYTEFLEYQQSAKKTFGTVTVAVAYEPAGETLHVDVMHAHELPHMDLNGSSDPFFTLEIRPAKGTEKVIEKKTTVKKETMSPLFDEKFFFPLKADRQQHAGTVLRLVCLDWDRFSANDIIGESYVPLHDIVTIATADEFKTTFTKVSAPIVRPGSGTGKAYTIVQSRKSFDPIASAFLGEREKFFGQMKADQKLGTSDSGSD